MFYFQLLVIFSYPFETTRTNLIFPTGGRVEICYARIMIQEEALNILKTGANVFLTGEPGSGKTHTINEYVKYLRDNGIQPAVTASTGIAATHIGGLTIHSWSGIGIKNSLTKRDLNNIVDNKRVANRIKKTKVLIIDEISMLSAETLMMVEKVCRTILNTTYQGHPEQSRRADLPFGGLQVVLVGDFFQLPPVQRRVVVTDEQSFFPDTEDDRVLFAFGSPTWRELDLTVCYLLEQHRQEDLAFLSALNAIRAGNATETARACFTARVITTMPERSATKLFPHNAAVDQINEIELSKLSSASHSYSMHSRGAPPLVESLQRHCLSPFQLELKIGAKVMFTKNNPELKFVNGTLGEIIGFSHDNSQPIVETRSGRTIVVEPMEWAIQDDIKVLAAISQFPLRLAWAITVHKSQGMSLDAAVMDLRQCFEYGQGYVALSRVRTLDGLYLLGFNERALEVHPTVSEQDARFRTASEQARQQFGAIDPLVLKTQQDSFIKSSGGVIGIGSPQKTTKESTHQLTRQLLVNENLSLLEIAKLRGLTIGTIIGHLEKLVAEVKIVAASDLATVKPKAQRFDPIKKALDTVQKKEGQMFLSQTRELLGPDYSFDEIRLVRLFLE